MAWIIDGSTNHSYWDYRIVLTDLGENTAGNYSTIRTEHQITRINTAASITGGQFSFAMTVNGSPYSGSGSYNGSVGVGQWITLWSREVQVDHNSDGTGIVNVSSSEFTGNVNPTYGSGSDWFTLPTIPRASQPSVSNGYPEMGGSVVIYTNRASGSFEHNVFVEYGSTSTLIGYHVGDNVTWNIPIDFASNITNGTSFPVNIKCNTYSGDSFLGTKYTSLTTIVPSSVVPSFSSIVAEIVSSVVPSAWGVYVKGKSQCRLTANGAAGAYGSWITSVSITGNGQSSNSNPFTSGLLNTVGDITFTATVTDSRGRTSTPKSVTINVKAYENPKIISYSTYRCTSAGVQADNGTYLRCLATFSISDCAGKNTLGIHRVYYRLVGTTAQNAITNITSGTQVTIGGGLVSEDYSYEIVYEVGDYFTTSSASNQVSSSFSIMDVISGGHGVAFGMAATKTDTFEVAPEWSFLLSSTKGLSLSSTDHPFQIGVSTGQNLRMSRTSLQSLNNGAIGNLYLQPLGGTIYIGNTATNTYMGIVSNTIQSISNGVGTTLYLNPNGGNVEVNGGQLITRGGDLQIWSSGNQGVIAMACDEGGYLHVVGGIKCDSTVYSGGKALIRGGGILELDDKDGSYMQVIVAGRGAYGVNWFASDSRLKENILDSDVDALDTVLQIHHHKFDWKQPYRVGSVPIGYVAHELKEIMPGAVYSVKQPEGSEFSELLQIDGTQIFPYLSKAIQQLAQRVEDLENKIA